MKRHWKLLRRNAASPVSSLRSSASHAHQADAASSSRCFHSQPQQQVSSPSSSSSSSRRRSIGAGFSHVSLRFLFTDQAAHEYTPPPVVRPSITWGIVGDREAQKEGREKVLEFLKSEGINTDEFANVELPTTVEVMTERLEFIKNLGLEKKHINEYPLIVCCSVKKNMVPVINYLEALGFTGSDLTKMLRRYPMVLHSSVSVDIQPVVVYLLGLGIPRLFIPRVLVCYPEMLGYRLEGTMSTSIAYLVSIGVHMKRIKDVVIALPEVLGMRVGNSIKPKVDYLCTLGMPREAVGRIIQHHVFILKHDLEDIKKNVELLAAANVRRDMLASTILQFPRMLMDKDLDKHIGKRASWLEKELKISKQDFGRALEQMPQIIYASIQTITPPIAYFKSKKLSVTDIGKMVVRCPQILVLDVKNEIRPSMEFFEKSMNRKMQELVEFPAYFTYGLEERVRFRHKRVAEKGLKWSLAWFLNCSQDVFNDRVSKGTPEAEQPERMFLMGGPVEQLQKPIEFQSNVKDEREFEYDDDDEAYDVE